MSLLALCCFLSKLKAMLWPAVLLNGAGRLIAIPTKLDNILMSTNGFLMVISPVQSALPCMCSVSGLAASFLMPVSVNLPFAKMRKILSAPVLRLN